jgi:hypothetical protein
MALSTCALIAIPVTMSRDGHKAHLRCRQAATYHGQKEMGERMAQVIESRFICDGRYRIQSIKALGRHRGRIIEIEDVDRRLRFHGTASKLEQMASKLHAQPFAGRGRGLRRGA